MFDIGLPELIMIFVVALIVIGPKQLPELGRSLGKGLAELKKSFDGVKAQVNSELEMTTKEEKTQIAQAEPPAGPRVRGRRRKTEATEGSEEARKEENAQ